MGERFFRSMSKMERIVLVVIIILGLIPFLTGAVFQQEGINWLVWYNVLPIGLAIIILISIVGLPIYKPCVNEGLLRLILFVEDDLEEEKRVVSGQLIGAGANRYCAQGYKTILYAKSIDLWYLRRELKLSDNCSWFSTISDDFRDVDRYAAFLVKRNYQPLPYIRNIKRTNLPDLPVDGEQIITRIVWFSTSELPSEEPGAKAISWLKQQITPNEIVPSPWVERTGLILSYLIPVADQDYHRDFSRSWIYDDAIAAIGLMGNGHLVEALTILNALGGQIQEDGKLGFAYNTRGDWIMEYYYSSAIAWVGLAFTYFQQKTNDRYFQALAERVASYLLSLQDANLNGQSFGSIRIDSNAPSYATDHNIIAYFFLRDLGSVSKEPKYTESANLIRDSLLNHHWNNETNRFDPAIGDTTSGLIEVTSLGGLFFLSLGDSSRAESCLKFAEDTYQLTLTDRAVIGYAPFEGYHIVWSQASLQIALVYKRLGNRTKHDAIIQQFIDMQDERGGVPYSLSEITADTNPEFKEWPSVAGTAWLTIVLSDDERFLGS